MESVSPISIGTLVLASLVFGLFPTGPAYCQEGGVALLLQQTPSQGGTVSPDIGVHHYDADAEVTLIAVPRPGYNFVYWLGDVLDPTASKTTALLDKPKVIVAVFQQVDDDQLIVGQSLAVRRAGGGAGSSLSPSASRGGGGGGSPPGGDPTPPTEEGDPPPDDPPDYPPDPPEVPEPATGLLLTLGGLALLRNRRSAGGGT